jgi:hypothetical protein
MRPLLAHCHLGLARLEHRAGRTAEARPHLAAALEAFRDLDMPFWLERSQAELGPLA